MVVKAGSLYPIMQTWGTGRPGTAWAPLTTEFQPPDRGVSATTSVLRSPLEMMEDTDPAGEGLAASGPLGHVEED